MIEWLRVGYAFVPFESPMCTSFADQKLLSIFHFLLLGVFVPLEVAWQTTQLLWLSPSSDSHDGMAYLGGGIRQIWDI